jgi:hypothetical protein
MNIKRTAHMMFLAGLAAMVMSLGACNGGRSDHLASALQRAIADRMAMHFKEHQLLIAKGYNHDILEENPELVLDTIVELASRIGMVKN